MEEINAKPKQDAESLPKTEDENQKEMTEETSFHPVQLSSKSEEEADESEIEVEQKLQQLLKDISEETLQLREFLTEENRLMNEQSMMEISPAKPHFSTFLANILQYQRLLIDRLEINLSSYMKSKARASSFHSHEVVKMGKNKRIKMGVIGAIRDFIDGLRFMKNILSWRVTWIPTLVMSGVVGFWLVYAFAHSLPNPWRAITIWGLIVVLVILSPGVLFLSGRKQ